MHTITFMTSQGSDTVTSIFLNIVILKIPKVYARWKWPSFHGRLKYVSHFQDIRVFR